MIKMGIRIDRYEEEKEEVQDMQEQEDNRIYEMLKSDH